nr:protein ALP1-like [Tanacetum cinerariifolium]
EGKDSFHVIGYRNFGSEIEGYAGVEGRLSSELVAFTKACQVAYEASKPKVHRTPVERDHYGAHDRLVMAYFSEHPQYEEATFRERFRISRRLFTKIVRDVTDVSQFFQERYNFTRLRSISALMKCTSAIRQMAYGAVPDSLDEYLQMGATTTRDSLRIFCKVVMNLYESIDCTNWPWTNCLVAFKAQFCRVITGQIHSFLLEAIASNDLWIWHAFFGVSGMNNDVNVLRQSPLFNDLSVPCKRGYYLTGGIYPQWSVLIKSIKNPSTNDQKRILYKTNHEAAKKDVERASGVLKQKWKIIKYPARGLTQSRLSDIMYTCIILHNMIIHDNGNAISLDFFFQRNNTVMMIM